VDLESSPEYFMGISSQRSHHLGEGRTHQYRRWAQWSIIPFIHWKESASSYSWQSRIAGHLPAHDFAFSYRGNWTATWLTPIRLGRRPL
jgi:hypothetical protein